MHPSSFRAARVAVVAGICIFAAGVHVHAAQLKVLATGAQEGAFKELIPSFENATGHKVIGEYAPTPQVMKRIEDGAEFDLVVIIDTPIKAPANQKHFAANDRTPISSAGLGVAVKTGATKPNISTTEAFKQTLLNAKSVVLLPDSLNGKHFLALFDRIGIAEQMKPKTLARNAPADVPQAVAKGEAEIALFVSNLLVGVPGVEYIGLIPKEYDQTLVFTAALSAKTKEQEAARAFIQHLRTPEAAAAMKRHGMEVPPS